MKEICRGDMNSFTLVNSFGTKCFRILSLFLFFVVSKIQWTYCKIAHFFELESLLLSLITSDEHFLC
ncbi:hypothetical protein PsaNZ63_19040 [Pseudomonas syringae pv. actinidiae]|nr:hypothetical protein PsaNZ63_19040 [Pseudomonas syringae pv. actinidiae]